MKVRNVSPFGGLKVPLLRRQLERDEVVDVSADHAAQLVVQPVNFAPADQEAAALLAQILQDHVAADRDPDVHVFDLVAEAAAAEAFHDSRTDIPKLSNNNDEGGAE